MMNMTIDKLDGILSDIGYYDLFKRLKNQKYANINYGKRIGTLTFNSLFDANDKFSYSSNVDAKEMERWSEILNSKNSSEEEFLIVCLKIFDWGKVYSGNVKKALELYEQNNLKNYLQYISKLLQSRKTIKVGETNQDIIWSSGWTKVYSFINSDILIYDSRVSAFLNYSLIENYRSLNERQKIAFFKLSNLLFNFGGATDRERKVSNKFGFINQHPKGIRGFNANLISSWILQLTKEKLDIEKRSIRDFERAFFMLGFDLKQLRSTTSDNE